MELEGVVQGGVIVPDGAATLPEGTRVRFELVAARTGEQPTKPAGLRPDGTPMTFADYFADLLGAATGLPEDFAAQIDHYRLGTPKR